MDFLFLNVKLSHEILRFSSEQFDDNPIVEENKNKIYLHLVALLRNPTNKFHTKPEKANDKIMFQLFSFVIYVFPSAGHPRCSQQMLD